MEMENMVDAINRLRERGYTRDYTALADGMLSSGVCDAVCDPAGGAVEEVVRFEGSSDPGDSAILLAVRCPCGHAGLFVSGYGVDVPAENAKVLRRLARSS